MSALHHRRVRGLATLAVAVGLLSGTAGAAELKKIAEISIPGEKHDKFAASHAFTSGVGSQNSTMAKKGTVLHRKKLRTVEGGAGFSI